MDQLQDHCWIVCSENRIKMGLTLYSREMPQFNSNLIWSCDNHTTLHHHPSNVLNNVCSKSCNVFVRQIMLSHTDFFKCSSNQLSYYHHQHHYFLYYGIHYAVTRMEEQFGYRYIARETGIYLLKYKNRMGSHAARETSRRRSTHSQEYVNNDTDSRIFLVPMKGGEMPKNIPII